VQPSQDCACAAQQGLSVWIAMLTQCAAMPEGQKLTCLVSEPMFQVLHPGRWLSSRGLVHPSR